MGNKTQFRVMVIKGDIKRALKKWKSKFEEFGIKDELVSRQEFLKPSLVNRKQKQTAIRNNERVERIRKENE